jgi:hypothetical protein
MRYSESRLVSAALNSRAIALIGFLPMTLIQYAVSSASGSAESNPPVAVERPQWTDPDGRGCDPRGAPELSALLAIRSQTADDPAARNRNSILYRATTDLTVGGPPTRSDVSQPRDFATALSEDRPPTRPDASQRRDFATALAADRPPTRPDASQPRDFATALAADRPPTRPDASQPRDFATALAADRPPTRPDEGPSWLLQVRPNGTMVAFSDRPPTRPDLMAPLEFAGAGRASGSAFPPATECNSIARSRSGER